MKKDKFCTTNNGSLANNACVCVLSVMLCLAKIGSYCLTFVNMHIYARTPTDDVHLGDKMHTAAKFYELRDPHVCTFLRIVCLCVCLYGSGTHTNKYLSPEHPL